jgi:hypothetical protein
MIFSSISKSKKQYLEFKTHPKFQWGGGGFCAMEFMCPQSLKPVLPRSLSDAHCNVVAISGSTRENIFLKVFEVRSSNFNEYVQLEKYLGLGKQFPLKRQLTWC